VSLPFPTACGPVCGLCFLLTLRGEDSNRRYPVLLVVRSRSTDLLARSLGDQFQTDTLSGSFWVVRGSMQVWKVVANIRSITWKTTGLLTQRSTVNRINSRQMQIPSPAKVRLEMPDQLIY